LYDVAGGASEKCDGAGTSVGTSVAIDFGGCSDRNKVQLDLDNPGVPEKLDVALGDLVGLAKKVQEQIGAIFAWARVLDLKIPAEGVAARQADDGWSTKFVTSVTKGWTDLEKQHIGLLKPIAG
ncbi:hypothetical protein HK405_002483, partial [Cladochytrium tenue]